MKTEIVCNKSGSKFPLTRWEVAVASSVVLSFVLGLLCVYMTMPASDYSFLKLPKSLEDLQILSSRNIFNGWRWWYNATNTVVEF